MEGSSRNEVLINGKLSNEGLANGAIFHLLSSMCWLEPGAILLAGFMVVWDPSIFIWKLYSLHHGQLYSDIHKTLELCSSKQLICNCCNWQISENVQDNFVYTVQTTLHWNGKKTRIPLFSGSPCIRYKYWTNIYLRQTWNS